MNLVTVPVTMITDAYRCQGWRATLRDRGVTVWRCQCNRPHASLSAADSCGLSALRARLGRRGMRVWSATYRPQQQFTPEEIEAMDEARELVVLETQISLPSWDVPESLPQKITEAITAIDRLENAAINDARTWEEIRHYQHTMKVIRTLYERIKEVRNRAQIGIMCAEWRGGVELIADQPYESKGTVLAGRAIGGDYSSQPKSDALTLAEKVGDRKYAWRLKELGQHSLPDVRRVCDQLHLAKKDATLNAVLEAFRAEQTKERRESSLSAEPLPEEAEYRIGDCRVVMDDIPDGSVAAIITDPPYGRDALPLVEFAVEYANRKLVDGGSLIFYVGTGLLPEYHAILSKHLTYWWEPVLLNDSAQKMLGAGVRASHKKILWYVKGKRRRAVHGDRITIVPDVLNDYRSDEMQQDIDLAERERAQSTRDKSDHQWAQGDAGVRVWIHHLTRQGERLGDVWLREPELIVDLFAGTGTWGRIATDMGRRWIGCDIVSGGTEEIAADDLSDAAD